MRDSKVIFKMSFLHPQYSYQTLCETLVYGPFYENKLTLQIEACTLQIKIAFFLSGFIGLFRSILIWLW